jgi:hypothetical protein
VRADDRKLAAIAAPAPKEATGMQDQIIDTVMTHFIHADAGRTRSLAAWIIVRDQIARPDELEERTTGQKEARRLGLPG